MYDEGRTTPALEEGTKEVHQRVDAAALLLPGVAFQGLSTKAAGK